MYRDREKKRGRNAVLAKSTVRPRNVPDHHIFPITSSGEDPESISEERPDDVEGSIVGEQDLTPILTFEDQASISNEEETVEEHIKEDDISVDWDASGLDVEDQANIAEEITNLAY